MQKQSRYLLYHTKLTVFPSERERKNRSTNGTLHLCSTEISLYIPPHCMLYVYYGVLQGLMW